MTALAVLWPLATGLAIGVPARWLANRNTMFAIIWFATGAVICTVLSALSAATGQWKWAALMAGCAAYNIWLWWKHWRRRKRDRAAGLAGAKSRARIAALVTRVRAAHQRGRPVLGGQP